MFKFVLIWAILAQKQCEIREVIFLFVYLQNYKEPVCEEVEGDSIERLQQMLQLICNELQLLGRPLQLLLILI